MRNFFALLALITALSLAPLEVKYELRVEGPFHNMAHFATFVATIIVFCWRAVSVRSILFRSGAIAGIPLVTEELEHLLFHNPYEWGDVALDLGGILAGVALMLAFRWPLRRQQLD